MCRVCLERIIDYIVLEIDSSVLYRNLRQTKAARDADNGLGFRKDFHLVSAERRRDGILGTRLLVLWLFVLGFLVRDEHRRDTCAELFHGLLGQTRIGLGIRALGA